MQIIPIKNRATGEYELATLIEDVDAELASTFQKAWSDSQAAIGQQLQDRDVAVPEHFGWHWGRKLEDARSEPVRCFAIVHAGSCQGMLLLSLEGMPSRRLQTPVSKTLYVEYLQSAPWNLALPGRTPEYSGVGISLIQCAIKVSLESGFDGALSLHSLPGAQPFYQRLGFDDFGPDLNEGRLHFMELAAGKAAILLGEETAQ